MDAAEHEQTFDIVPQEAAEVVTRDDNGRVDSNGARELARRRWEKYYAAIEAGASDAAGSPEKAMREISRVTTERAMDKSDRKQLQAAHMMMSKLMGEVNPQGEADGHVTLSATLPVEAIPEIAKALSEARRLRSQDPPD